MPLISVITITLNDQPRLPQTIASVAGQTGASVEHIIVDGNGNDGTADWLRQNSFPLVRWVSESDTGIYDAMNKGLDIARGQWIYFLGAGDELLPGSFDRIAPLLTNNLDALVGHVRMVGGGRFIGTFSEAMLVSNLIHHQAAFYNRQLFDTFQYDISMKAMSDYELNLLLYLHRKDVCVIDLDMALCDVQGISAGLMQSLWESNRIKYRHLGLWQGTRYGAILAWKYGMIYLKKLKKNYLQ
ncbi:MAG: glycosyltransferase [Rudanella sp.]|nr:glycosyltransferase [Rudanella sp.]